MRANLPALAAMLLMLGAPCAAQEFRTVTLMSWNVENLFDTQDDPNNPFDNTYLPLAVKQSRPDHEQHCRTHFDIPNFRRECLTIDWTEDRLRKKLSDIAGVIRAVQPQPDVIILPELENPGILTRLNTDFLGGLGYSIEIELELDRHRSRPRHRCRNSLAAAARGNAACSQGGFPERQGPVSGDARHHRSTSAPSGWQDAQPVRGAFPIRW